MLALDTLLNRRVALKRMLTAGADRDYLRDVMLREARRASQINDPHIAAIYDVLDFDDQVVLVIELTVPPTATASCWSSSASPPAPTA